MAFVFKGKSYKTAAEAEQAMADYETQLAEREAALAKAGPTATQEGPVSFSITAKGQLAMRLTDKATYGNFPVFSLCKDQLAILIEKVKDGTIEGLIAKHDSELTTMKATMDAWRAANPLGASKGKAKTA